MRILVIAAHPDDEVLGCGGKISKHVTEGDDVHVIVLADGVTSRDGSGAKEIKRRKQEFHKAADTMGVKRDHCYWFGLPDQRLDSLPILEIIQTIEKIAIKVKPDIVYTHHWGDLNRDHRICCEAAMTAFRPSRTRVKFYCFEIPGNMDLLPPLIANKFKPDHFIDVSSVIERKVNALSAYKSELRAYPSPLSGESVFRTAKMRGKTKKMKYAEAFVAWRPDK